MKCAMADHKVSSSIPHSRSLEHYQDPAILVAHKHINARHSLSDAVPNCDLTNHTYDCIDPHIYVGNGYRPTHYSSIDHGYGVGHRYPAAEPHYAQLAPNCTYSNPAALPPCGPHMGPPNAYAPVDPARSHYECVNNISSCGTGYRTVMGNSCPCQTSAAPMPCEIHGKYLPKTYGRIDQPHNPLINFGDKQIDPAIMYASHHGAAYHQPYGYIEEANGKLSSREKQIQANYGDFHLTADAYSDKRRAGYRKECNENYDTKDSRSSRASDFDSFDDSNNLNFERDNNEPGTDHSASSKIRDGVGSYETWNYVFQNIGKNGPANGQSNHNVDELNVDGMNLNATEKRRSRNSDGTPTQVPTTQSAKLLNGRGSSRSQKSDGHSTNTLPKEKSVKRAGIAVPEQSTRANARPKVNGGGVAKKSALKNSAHNKPTDYSRPNEPTVSARPAASEWNCKFCTFLNPSGERICQMCFKSQDFVSDPPKASTCV